MIWKQDRNTAFHKKGFDGVATTERYSTVQFPKIKNRLKSGNTLGICDFIYLILHSESLRI